MRDRHREAGIPLLLGAAAFAFAFAQRPGLATADTKINLHVDPGRFLSDVASMWTSTGQLGGVQAGQQAGYLFPMGPLFAFGHLLGLSDWVVQRLWLGSLLALAAWGVVRLLDALLGRPRGIAHLAAGAVTLLNPYVVTYANRTTVTLLAYAALPWLLVVVHRGLRDARGWRWPAAFALLVTASGGGINGAVTAWMLLGPVLLLLYELVWAPVRWIECRQFLARTVLLTVLASLWWLVPAWVQSSYGNDFLRFTEQPGTIWGTTSATESLRLMSFWLSYVGIGFTGRAIPYFDDSHTLLFSVPVVLATLLLPAAALTGFVWTRRWRYGPFFLGLALVAVLVIQAGFPDGTPLRHGLSFVYDHVAAVRFLRASYKAAPLLALSLACLAGVGAGEAWRRLPRASLRVGGSLALLAVLVGAAWPLVSGRAQDAQVSFKRVPAAWRVAAHDLDRELPPGSRAIVLPGELFSFYRWGGTVDPILPALARRPAAVRSEVPYSDPRATDLLWTIDGLVHQQRLLPAQLPPLLSLIGVRAVVTGSDDDLARSDAPPPADAASELAAQPGLSRPVRSYGPHFSFTPSGLGPALELPEVRRYDVPRARTMVRFQRAAAPVIVDGSAGAIAGLGAFGSLSASQTVLYSGDLIGGSLRSALAEGGEVVISDSNRRQAFVAGTLDQNTGPVLTPEQNVSADGIILDPFGRGPDFQTVASYSGIRSVEAPSSPQRPQFPEHSAFAAIDGSSPTAWLADRTLGSARRWLEVDFERPLALPYVDLLPYGAVRQVRIGAHTFAVRPGWNRLSLALGGAGSLRVYLTGVGAGAVGITELRIPGVHATEELRLPLDAAGALDAHSLERVSLMYVFERVTGDHPFRRDLAYGPGDAEQTMRRAFALPAGRRFAAEAWVNVFSQAPDDQLDQLAGYRGPAHATSSSRFDGQPRWRASRAFDGDPRTAWIGDYEPSRPAWIQWRANRVLRISALRLRPPAQPVRRPAVVRIRWPGGSTPPLRVGGDGVVDLPHLVTTRVVRIEVLRAFAPPGASAAQQRAIGIADVVGLPQIVQPPRARFAAPCGAARVRLGGAMLSLRVAVSSAAFEQGDPLFARSCGDPVALPAGTQHLVVQRGLFAIDELRLSSPAPRPVASIANPGPSWLVYGQGYNRGWEASCDGRSLGRPVPIDGYANGWRVRGGCRQVRLTFAPEDFATVGYVLSGVAGALCLALFALGVGRRRRVRDDPPVPLADAPPRQWSPARALVAALVVGVVFAFVFGIGAGAVSVPITGLVLRQRVGARALTLCAGALLGAVVPILYLAHPGQERGGNHFAYAMQHLGAHYVGVAAIGLLIAALWRTLAGANVRFRMSAEKRDT